MGAAVRALEAAGHRVEAISTTGPGSATQIAQRLVAAGADLILVAGGDGTINEAVNGMVHSSVPLGVLPGGTANVLASEVGIAKGIVHAAEQVADWTPERLCLGLHRGGAKPRHFLLMCGAGLDAHIVYQLSSGLKNWLGKPAYWIAGFSQLGKRLPEFDVEADVRMFRASFALASRVCNYGGDLEIATSVSLLEDRFELVLFSGESSFRYLRYMAGVVRRRLDRTPGVTIVQASRIRLSAPEDRRIYTQVDGEYTGPLPATLELVPASLTLLLPPRYVQSRRILAARDPVGDPEWITSPTR